MEVYDLMMLIKAEVVVAMLMLLTDTNNTTPLHEAAA
jgi:hypothetical protein